MCKKFMCMNIWLLFMFVCSSLWLLCICIWRCHREVFRFLRAGVICGCEQPSMGSGNCTIVLGRAIGTQLWAIFSVSISLHSLCLQNGNKPISSLFVMDWEKKCFCQSISHTVEKWVWKHYYWMTRNNLQYKLLTQTYIECKYVNSYFWQRKLGQFMKEVT